MAGMLRVPRSRGALSGVLLILLGAWGALISFIGPYFHYAYTPDHAWTYNTDRLWLEVLPGAVVVLGGLIALVVSARPTAVFGAWLAALGGAWFVVGRPLSGLWTTGHVVAAGQPVGGPVTRVVENIGFFTGLGVVILFFAALALGRFTVIGAREAARAEEVETEEVYDREPATVGAGSTLPAESASDGGYADTAAENRDVPQDRPSSPWGMFSRESQSDAPTTEPGGYQAGRRSPES